MSLMQLFQCMGDEAAAGTTLALTTISVAQSGAGATSSGVKFNADGSIDEIGPGVATYTQIHVGEWASDEPAATGADYEVRCASVSVGGWDVEAAATGVWVALSSDRIWRVTRTAMEGAGTDAVTCVFEVREIADTGNSVSATVTASATIT